MLRREFITLLSGAAVAWPLAVRAQHVALPVIGFIHSGAPEPFAHLAAAFRRGLSESGLIEGKNVVIEFRWARGVYDRLPALAAELVCGRVAVIVAAGGEPSALAAKAATSTIPIVFIVGGDPVKAGLVTSLNRPTGNLTGVSLFTASIGAKRLELLSELLPNAGLIAFLVNPDYPTTEAELKDMTEAAAARGQQLSVLTARTEKEIDEAFAEFVQHHAAALIIGADTFYTNQRDQFVTLAARHAIPTIYFQREFPARGGLMSYGNSLTDAYRQVGIYTGRILKGEKPADLPVMLPTKFELVINLKTAKALGLEIPPKLLALTDEVIE
jgi:putative ABC transport system substrate-binding protein